MNILVTGGSGFLGGNLIYQMVERGLKPICLKRPGALPPHLVHLPVVWDEKGYQDGERLKYLASGADLIIHCAAKVGTANSVTEEMWQANVVLTRQLIESAGGGSTRFVFCSTVVTCGVSENGEEVDENGAWNLDRYGMSSGYTVTKKKAEDLVLQAAATGLDAVVVNPCYMFGPYDWKPSSSKLVLDVCKRKIPGYPGGCNNFVDVRDVARGILLAVENGKSGHRYILGGQNMGYRELFDRIAAIAGSVPITRPLPKWLARMVGWLGDYSEKLSGNESLFNSTGIALSFANCRYTSKKATDELGYSPSGIDSAIEDCLQWFKAHGYL